MIPGAEALVNSPATAVGVLVLVLIALMTGLLVPGRTAKNRVDDANKRAADFEKLYGTERVASDLLRAQVMQLAGAPSQEHTVPTPAPDAERTP